MLYLVKTWNSLKNIFRYFFGIHEDKALHKNWIFWIAVLVPLGIICWLMYTLTQDLIADGLYNPHVSSDSLASFLNYYAFPITLLTLPLTLGVMFNRFHSSKQKAKSNRLVEQNNMANNFYNHYKYFSEHCEAINTRFESSLVTIKPEVLYKQMFPHSSVNKSENEIDISIITDAFKSYMSNIDSFVKHIESVGLEPIPTVMNEYGEPTSGPSKFYLKELFTYIFEIPGLQVTANITVESELLGHIKNTHEVLLMLVNFHGATNSNQLVTSLNIKFDELIQDCFDEKKELVTKID